MYDPTIGRWISEDPIGFKAGDANLYRYVGNRSTTHTDPTGLFGGWGSASAEQWGISNHSPNKKRRPSVYAYYLWHPWAMDDDLETGFYIAGGGAAAAGGVAGGLVIAGVGSVTIGTASSVAGMITAELADTALEAGVSAATGYDVFFPVSPLDLGQDLGKYSIKKGLKKCVSGTKLPVVNPHFRAKPTTHGRAGEVLSGLTGNKTKITINGRNSVPDGLTATTLTEVKNVANLSYTQQLRDFSDFAQQHDLVYVLYVRKNTTLTGPLQEAIRNGDIILKIIPGL